MSAESELKTTEKWLDETLERGDKLIRENATLKARIRELEEALRKQWFVAHSKWCSGDVGLEELAPHEGPCSWPFPSILVGA